MTDPEAIPSFDPPFDPALEQLLVELDEALLTGRATEKLEREIAGRFGAATSAIVSTLKFLNSVCAPFDDGRSRKGDTATMSEPVTWCGPTADGSSSRFGRFELLGRIGAGGSGVVFRARDPQLGRYVALKVARAEVLFSKEARQRFLREARLLAALRHANIIPVYDAGDADGLPYIVQELCDGPNLAAWLRKEVDARRPVPITVAARWAMQIAQAVAHAHQAGIVHRDLKPANVLLEQSDCRNPGEPAAPQTADDYLPRITDFGIAKLFGSDDEVTAAHAVLGTAAYMAPEQAEGKTREVGAPADVYSLGVILYELLTGRRPIEGKTDIDTLRRLAIDEPLPLSQLRPGVPRDLQAICHKCLEKSPARRYLTADDLGRDLERFLAGVPVTARPVGFVRRTAMAYRRQRRTVRMGLTGLLVVLVTALMLRRLTRETAQEQGVAERYSSDIRSAFNVWYDNAEHLRDNSNAGEEMRAALAGHIPKPGEVDRRGFEWHYLWRLCHPAEAVGSLERVLSFKAHELDAYFVKFSQDGSRLATAGRDHTARVWDAATGKRICTCAGHTDEVNWVDFSPDQQRLATASDDHTVKVWNAATGKEEFTLRGHAGEVIAVLFSPDGNTLVSGDKDGLLKLWDLSTRSSRKTVHAHQGRIQSLAWGPGDHCLATTADDGEIRTWEMPEMLFRSEHRIVGTKSASFSPDGELVASGGDGTINIDDVRSGGRRSTFSNHYNHIESVQFSPFGKQIASCDSDGLLRLWDLPTRQGWTAAPVRYQASKTGNQIGVGLWCVAYSSDGTRMATSARDGQVEIWDTSVTPRWSLIAKNRPSHHTSAAVFSPDGARMALSIGGKTPADSQWQIWETSASRPSILREAAYPFLVSACFSREGDELVVGSVGKIGIIDAETGETRSQIALAAGSVARGVAFDAQGSLIVLEEHHQKWSIHLFDRRTGERIHTIVDGFFRDGVYEQAFAVSGDGQLAAFCAPAAGKAALLELPKGRLRPERLGRRPLCGYAEFSPDAAFLAIAVNEGVELWDVRTNREIAFFSGLGRMVGPLKFSADGRLLIVVSPEQREVHLFDVKQQKLLFALPIPAEPASHARSWRLAVSPDNKQVICSFEDVQGDGGVYLFGGHRALPSAAVNSLEAGETKANSGRE